MKSIWCNLAAAGAMLAAESSVSGPSLGHIAVADSIRPVLGIAGSATLGEPVSAVTRAVVAGRYALGCVDGELTRIELSSATRSVIGPCAGAWSITATGAAVVVSASAVRVVTAEAERTYDLQASGCAISDGADLLLCTTARGIIAVEAGSGSSSLVLAGGTLAAFVPGTRDAVLADAGGVHLLRNGSELSLLAAVESATAIGATAGHAVAAAGTRLLVVRLSDFNTESMELSAVPTGFSATANADVLHAVTRSGPAWLLATGPEASRLLFIPQPEAARE